MAHRIERINSLIRQEISELLQRQVKDPRLGNFIAVTEVNTSPDLKHARVYVSYMSDDGDKEDVLKALVSASGFLRSKMAKSLKLRYTPELRFYLDESFERGRKITDLIDKISKGEL